MLNEIGCAYSFEDPSEDDDVPILLSNRAPATYFESVLSMYSLPAYGTFDPTAIMSVFYALIFGLMFADVGYGLLVFFGCLLMLKVMHPGDGMKRMLKMFMCCSISSVAFGALLGGYFGDLPQAIMQNFMGMENVGTTAIWFDLLENPILFFIIALAVGVIHIVCGLCIKFYVLCRDGHVFDAFADEHHTDRCDISIHIKLCNKNTLDNTAVRPRNDWYRWLRCRRQSGISSENTRNIPEIFRKVCESKGCYEPLRYHQLRL